MNIKCADFLFAIIALGITASGVHAESIFDAFESSPAISTTPAMNKTQAKAALSAAARARIDPKFLDKLLENESNEFIVVFDEETTLDVAEAGSPDQRLIGQPLVFENPRDRVRHTLANSDIEFLEELRNLPHALVRTNSHAALVALLNQPGVKGVYPNITLKLTPAPPVRIPAQRPR